MSVAPDILAELPLFSSLTADELERVAGWAELRTASPGDRICGEGASGYSFFVVRRGSARVTRHEEELGLLGPGDFFGELAIVGDGRRTATVTAVEPTELLVLFGTEYRRLEAELPEVVSQIRRVIEARKQTA